MVALTSLASPAVAAVACAAMCVAAALLRVIARARHTQRLEQLRNAAVLLENQARSMEVFLDSPTAPARLKSLLLRFTEFAGERREVARFAASMAQLPAGAPANDAESQEILTLVNDLERSDPELGRAFLSAIVCGTFGAMLRWPESARGFNRGAPTMLADGRRELVAAVRALTMRDQRPPFDAGRQNAVPA